MLSKWRTGVDVKDGIAKSVKAADLLHRYSLLLHAMVAQQQHVTSFAVGTIASALVDAALNPWTNQVSDRLSFIAALAELKSVPVLRCILGHGDQLHPNICRLNISRDCIVSRVVK